MEQPTDVTDEIHRAVDTIVAALDVADSALVTLVAIAHALNDKLSALDRAVAAHPAGARDDVESGNVWPDDDEPQCACGLARHHAGACADDAAHASPNGTIPLGKFLR